ncbi:MAG: hypothetical protein N3E39_00520 [Candidatus Methanomethylicia archaeon]|nr:hypothetical protein [Candidatus Methanomethylicia archaeon]
MNKVNVYELKEKMEDIRRKLYEKSEEREKLYLKIREIQKLCGEAISLIQQDKFNEAKEKMVYAEERIKKELSDKKLTLCELNEAYTTMLQEYVEVKSLLYIEEKGVIPCMEDLNVDERAYVLGLADLMGELKRRSITNLIRGEVNKAKEKMEIINQIFQALEVLEYPRSLVPGLRKKLDDMRKSIEDLERIIAISSMNMKIYEILRIFTSRNI